MTKMNILGREVLRVGSEIIANGKRYLSTFLWLFWQQRGEQAGTAFFLLLCPPVAGNKCIRRCDWVRGGRNTVQKGRELPALGVRVGLWGQTTWSVSEGMYCTGWSSFSIVCTAPHTNSTEHCVVEPPALPWRMSATNSRELVEELVEMKSQVRFCWRIITKGLK